jgi:beta-lactamase regulating signal transducer with metallopeptidase domain
MGSEGAFVVEAGLALLHFVWQGMLVAGLLFGILGLLDRRRARLRYNLSCAALALMVLLPLATGYWLSNLDAAGRSDSEEAVGLGMVVAPEASVARSSEGSVAAAPAPSVVPPAAISPAERSRLRSQALAREEAWTAAWHAVRGWSYRSAPWLCWLWAAGVAGMSVRLAFAAWGIRILTRRKATPVARAWRVEVGNLAARLGVRRSVKVLQSGLVQVPMLVGYLQPVILLPAAALTGLAPEHLRLLLAHELAHVKRLDPLVQLLQRIAETLLFYHPAVWWVSRQIRTEREHCCDDVAVSLCRDPLSYAEALAALAGLSSATPALAVSARGGRLFLRIQRLLDPVAVDRYQAAGTFTGLAVAAVVVAFAWSAHASDASRFVHFPDDRSVGALLIRDTAGDGVRATASGYGEGWRSYAEARGWVEIPAHTELMLRVRPSSESPLSGLADVGPDDLQKLDLAECGVRDEDLRHIAHLTGLKSLSLYRNPVTDAGLSHLAGMTSLVWLVVERSGVSGADAPVLDTLENLEYFDAYDTPFNDRGMDRLVRLKRLKAVGLESAEVSTEGLRWLAELPALEELNLEETATDDTVLAALAGLPSLRALNVARCAITDAGVAALAGAETLEHLDIQETRVSDAGLDALARLPRLRSLVADGSRVSQRRLAAFQAALAAWAPDSGANAQRSTNPQAPRVGVVMSHFTATGPSYRGKPWGYMGQQCQAIAAFLDEHNFDVYAVVEPGTETLGELPGLLEATRTAGKTIPANDAASLGSLDVILCKNMHNVEQDVLAAFADAVRGGVGFVLISTLGDTTPGEGHPSLAPLIGWEGGVKYLGHETPCTVLAAHPILGPMKPGDTLSLSMIDGYRAPRGLAGAQALVGPPAGAPEDFYPVYVHTLGEGRVVHLQWYELVPKDVPLQGRYDIYIRAVNWAAKHPADSQW